MHIRKAKWQSQSATLLQIAKVGYRLNYSTLIPHQGNYNQATLRYSSLFIWHVWNIINKLAALIKIIQTKWGGEQRMHSKLYIPVTHPEQRDWRNLSRCAWSGHLARCSPADFWRTVPWGRWRCDSSPPDYCSFEGSLRCNREKERGERRSCHRVAWLWLCRERFKLSVTSKSYTCSVCRVQTVGRTCYIYRGDSHVYSQSYLWHRKP